MNPRSSRIQQAKFTCKFCRHVFVTERRYFDHKCEQMKRLEEFQTPLGQAAWSYYQMWFKAQKRMIPPTSSFLSSKYFRTFVNFAKHVQTVGLPKPDKFIWLMKEKQIQPTIWTNDNIYSTYIEFLDRAMSPLDQAKISIDTLLNIADKTQIDVSYIFNHITPNDIIHLLRTRQLSPWLLLRSKQFKLMFKEKTSPEQKIIIETFIRPDYWVEKFLQHQTDLKIIDDYITALNI